MRIIPVLDLMAGQVVRGVGGRRHEYRPIVSPLVESSSPLHVAQAFRRHFGLAELYLADLDAIAGQPADCRLYHDLIDDGFALWVDAGVRSLESAQTVAASGVEKVVAALETISHPDILQAIAGELGPKVIFSLDLKAGKPLTSGDAWPAQPWDIAQEAIRAGVRHILVLDLAQVGSDRGTGTEELCARLAQAAPHVELTAGGGVRGRDDVLRLRDAGVHNVLVASALHDGRLTRADCEVLTANR